jgi:hypothetical protein
MNVGRVFGRFSVVSLAVGYVGLATAADQPVVVAPAAPVAVAEVCPTCTAGPAGRPCGLGGCKSCNGCNPKKPVVGQLRAGACYGYFQTQWHRWEDVCPLPYQGVGLNDVPRASVIPAPPAVPTVPRSDAPPQPGPMPTTVPPTKGGLPGIPPPESKFGK